ncbi:MAG TPA: sulfite oxidase, partial [Pirellulales bacterium]|nr:sulfite oxidase [Pirellulales bacterium]
VEGKDAGLIVHNAKTIEIETPLALLRKHNLTPKQILFVRNNQELPGARTTAPADNDDWKIEVIGLVEYPRTLDLKQLRELEQTEVEMVLQCSGSGRKLFSRAAKVKGSPWEQGAVGNVRFRGVPLAKVVEAMKLDVSPDALFLTAEGKDDAAAPDAADFEHSLPLADVRRRSLLALEMNGEPIPAVHGGPVRLVTPGYYGTMQIKWLSRLRFESRETFNHHQRRRYRTPREPIAPGSDFVYDFDNSDANWRMRIKSIIFSPLDGEMLKIGPVEVRGVAFNDGQARIDTVEISLDDGRTWQRARLDTPDSPYAWYHWSAGVTLKKGPQRIMARATDALGRSQPLDGTIGWNPAGYGWNGVQTVQVQVA